MESERWRRLQELFDNVADLSPDERDAFLDRACADDPVLRHEVESLAAADGGASRALGGAVADAADSTAQQLVTKIESGTRIGAYEVVRDLGVGGMGVVYLARRADEQYQQEVAIKLLRGFETPERLSRFRRERQILAGLQHPTIARLLDGGETDDGIPYLVMEYVEGKPIDVFCDDSQLSTRQRLELFRTVCNAIHYAHSRLIVHRDIKPGNILVTTDGSPRLLDFGIAKLLDADAAENDAEQTATGVRLLTPHYASPEQVRGEPVTTASDVYSLGILLYELLTGSRPYDINTPVPTEIERIVCDTTPKRPSTAITSNDLASTRVSDARGTRHLQRELAGDLDNIVLMALRKEPERRYASAEQLAEDIRLHLEGRPVIARPDTMGYRAGKFVRRNVVGVSVATLFLLVIIGSAITGFTLYFRAEQARRAAVVAQTQAEENAETAEQVTRFLLNLFKMQHPNEALGRDITIREALDAGAKSVREELADQPLVMTRVMRMIGIVYQSMGEPERARPLLEDALEVSRRELAERPLVLADALMNMGDLILDTGHGGDAVALYRESLAVRELALGPDDPLLAPLIARIAMELQYQAQFNEALDLFMRSMRIEEVHRGEDSYRVAYYTQLLGLISIELGRYEEARAYFERTLKIRIAALDSRHPLLASTRSAYSGLLSTVGEYAAARDTILPALAMQLEVLGEVHPNIARSSEHLATAFAGLGDYARAESLYTRAIHIYEGVYGPEGSNRWFSAHGLARVCMETGRYEASEDYFRESIALCEYDSVSEHRNTAYGYYGLGQLAERNGDRERALDYYAQAIAIREQTFDPDHPLIRQVQESQATALRALGRGDLLDPAHHSGERAGEQ